MASIGTANRAATASEIPPRQMRLIGGMRHPSNGRTSPVVVDRPAPAAAAAVARPERDPQPPPDLSGRGGRPAEGGAGAAAVGDREGVVDDLPVRAVGVP